MKKLLLFALICAFAQMSNAAYLYWQVSAADISEANAATSWLGLSVNAAKIYSSSDAGATWTAKTIYLNEADVGTVAPVPNQTMYTIDIGDNLGSGYSYYVELGNYSGSVWSIAAKSASEQISYTESGDTHIVSSLSDITRVSPWHAGSYRAVPEPTSGLMLLLGAAVLGLRRKNRSVA